MKKPWFSHFGWIIIISIFGKPEKLQDLTLKLRSFTVGTIFTFLMALTRFLWVNAIVHAEQKLDKKKVPIMNIFLTFV